MGYMRSSAIPCFNVWAEQPFPKALGLRLQSWPLQWVWEYEEFLAVVLVWGVEFGSLMGV